MPVRVGDGGHSRAKHRCGRRKLGARNDTAQGLIYVPCEKGDNHPMAKNETTSKSVASVAGKVLSAGKATPAQAKTLAASVLTQAADKPKPKK